LRYRLEDVANLTQWWLKNALANLGMKPHANLHAEVLACQRLLCSYAWPGNVRELRNICERLALFLLAEPLQALTPKLLMRAMPELSEVATVPVEAVSAQESNLSKQELNQVVQRFKGNRAAAAQQLGISRTTLWRKLKE